MRIIPPILGVEPSTVPKDAAAMTARANEARKTCTTIVAKVGTQKAIRVKKAHAKEKYDASLKSFTKFDTDKDKQLSRKEIQAFAQGEYGFKIPADHLDTILRVLVKDGKKGVEQANFHRLKSMIGIAREAALDAKRIVAREAREKEVAALKETLEADIKNAQEKLKETQEALSKAEAEVTEKILEAGKAKAVEMVALSKAAEDIIDKISEAVAKTKEECDLGEREPELKMQAASEGKRLASLLASLESRLTKAKNNVEKVKAAANKKDAVELEGLRKLGLEKIYFHQGAKKLDLEGLYALFDKRKTGKVQESSFVNFFASCQQKEDDEERISEDDCSRLFNFLDKKEDGHIKKEDFMALLRRLMKVVKASVISEGISVKSSAIRRLNENEVLECLTGPQSADGEEEIQRIKVRCTSDGVEGWVTPVGNRGTTFMQDGGDMHKVTKETILTGSFVIGEDKETKDRKLKVGEVLKVLEFAKKEESSGLMRMKVQVKSDGVEGWVTSVGNTGIKFVEVL